MKISYSILSTFQECPLKYKYAYIDNLKKKETPYKSVGESIHLALSRFFKLSDKSQRTIQNLHSLLRKSWKREGFLGVDEERRWGQLALEMLTNFYNTFDPYASPLMLEEYFSIDLNDDVQLVGKIDRVDKLSSRSFELIDYKTGKNVISQEEANNGLQFTIYYLALVKGYNIYPEKLSYIFLQTNDKISTSRTQEQLEEVIIHIKKVAAQIRSAEVFEPRPYKFCSNCDFNNLCPVYIQQQKNSTFLIN